MIYMETVSHLVLFLIGIITLYIGAESLVRGAVRISRQLGISPLVVGLTVVSFGTSAPEFMVSIMAAIKHSEDLAIGNIIGSNIANIGLIIGLSALIKPLVVNRKMLIREAPILILSSFLVFYFFRDLLLTTQEGFILLVLMLVFLVSIIFIARKDTEERVKKVEVDKKSSRVKPGFPISFIKSFYSKIISRGLKEREEQEKETKIEEEFSEVTPEYPISFVKLLYSRIVDRDSYFSNFLLVIVGMVLLALGSDWLVRSSIIFAEKMGISDVIIGITIVAIGTSLPELATSVVSAIKKESDISLGNIVGSNLFNTLFVLGFVGSINPIPIDRQTAFQLVPIMIVFTLVFTTIMWTKKKISRIEAGLLFLGYIVFIAFLYFVNK